MNKAKGLGFNDKFCTVYKNTKIKVMEQDDMTEKEYDEMIEEGIKRVRENNIGLTERELLVYLLATTITTL